MHELIAVFADHSHPQINTLISQALCCPDCGASGKKLILMSNTRNPPRYLIACRECGVRGPFGKSMPEAVRRWNSPPGFLADLKKRWGFG